MFFILPEFGHINFQWRHNERDGVSNHWRLGCLLNRLFKENIKAPRHWLLWGESTGDRWFLLTKGSSKRGKCFYFDDVLMVFFRFPSHGLGLGKWIPHPHYNDVIMSPMESQITSLTIVYSNVYSGTDRRKHQTQRHLPLCGEFTGYRWIPRTKGQQRGKCFRLMTSSCDELNRNKIWYTKYLCNVFDVCK